VKNPFILSLRADVVVGRKIASGIGKICFWYEGRTGIVTEGPMEKEKLRGAAVCVVCGAKNSLSVKFSEYFMFNVAEKVVAYKFGKVTEPDVSDRRIVFKPLDGEKECVDNTSSKGLIPQLIS